LRGFALRLALAGAFAFAALRRAGLAAVFFRAAFFRLVFFRVALRFGADLRRVGRFAALRFAAFRLGARILADFFFDDFLRTAMTFASPIGCWSHGRRRCCKGRQATVDLHAI
jgi:hypothetical protein